MIKIVLLCFVCCILSGCSQVSKISNDSSSKKPGVYEIFKKNCSTGNEAFIDPTESNDFVEDGKFKSIRPLIVENGEEYNWYIAKTYYKRNKMINEKEI